MPFENSRSLPKRVAVIGGGISGLGAANMLAPDNQVVLFEAEWRPGGHARTVLAGKSGQTPVDTGFIVFNFENYPNLTKLFDRLGVPLIESNMSFSASLDGGRLEYGLRDLDALFAQKRNVLRPQFLRMIKDVLTFNDKALEASRDPELTVGGLLELLGTGPWFRDYYILPLGGAIWSTPTREILDFPARALVQFFENHALLSHTGQHQWYTVRGGSIEYVRRLTAALEDAGVDIRLSAKVEAVRRTETGVEVKTPAGVWEPFDEVVFATHADDTLAMLSDASEVERKALAAVRYQPNHAILHGDTSIMPKRKNCWASWVYTEDRKNQSDRIDLTYWMNLLQGIDESDPLFVTLNTARPIREELIYDQVTFRHPVYDHAALQAQGLIRAMNGANNTWFCGAWMKNGFHEDGLASAVDVVEGMRERNARVLLAAE